MSGIKQHFIQRKTRAAKKKSANKLTTTTNAEIKKRDKDQRIKC